MTAELLDQHGNPVRSKHLKGVSRGDWRPALPEQLRMLITSMPNSGKTEFACSIPNALVIDLARHTRMVPRVAKGTHIEEVSDIETVFGIVDDLAEHRGKKRPWNIVVFDDGDILMEMLIRWLSKHPKYNPGLRRNGPLDELWSITEYGDKGKGWYVIRDELMERTVDKLSLAGYGWLITGNFSQKSRPMADGSVNYDYKPVLSASIRDALKRMAHYELTFTMHHEVREVQVGTKSARAGDREIVKKITEKRATDRVYASVVPPSGDDEARHAKARFIEHMPKDEDGDVVFEIARKNPWGSWVNVYLEAVRKTAEEMGVELDKSIADLLAAGGDAQPKRKVQRGS